MVRLFEFESKNVLKAYGISVPKGQVLNSAHELRAAYRAMSSEVMIKAQIPIGGRMKSGGVVFADNEDEAENIFNKLYGAKIRDFLVERVLLEEKLSFQREYYLGITYDQIAKQPVIVFSNQGGIDVEEISSDSFNTRYWDLTRPLSEYECRELLLPFDFEGGEFLALSTIIHKLATIFCEMDATLVEVNPLVTNSFTFCALDCHIELDEDAFYRNEKLREQYGINLNLNRSKQAASDLEAKAAEIDRGDHRGVAGRVVEFDGDLALLIGGGGASLAVFDAVKAKVGRPANYCEIGGNPSVDKIRRLTKLLLAQPRVKKIAVIMNVVNNTRVDLVARGVVKAIIESGFDPAEKISVFRIPGAWEEEGYKILRKYGIRFCGRDISIDEAANIAVQSMK